VAGSIDHCIADNGFVDRFGRGLCAGSFYLHIILRDGQVEKNRNAVGDSARMCRAVPGQAMVAGAGGGLWDRPGGVVGAGGAGWGSLGLDEAVGGVGLGLGEGDTYGDVFFGAGAAGFFRAAPGEDRVAS
jgi:hypothetical protein